ncbi:MAG TPA: alpha/beta hydrolase [Gaiellaceae bacterium]
MSPLRETTIEARGMRFGALEAGEPEGHLVLCLHGFPDSAWTWRRLLLALADAGHHAVAPFMRGYAPTDLPEGEVRIADLVADLLALEEVLRGTERGTSVAIGHDWGAAVVHVALETEPRRWACAVTESVPPPAGFSIEAISPAQLHRSWYSFLFQLPDASVPEHLVGKDDLALIDELWRDWSPGLEAPDEIGRAKDALRPPGRLRAAIGYYRGAPTSVPSRAEAEASREALARLEVPLLYLHGADDGCIGVDTLEARRPFFPPAMRAVVLESIGHFVHLERPDEINRLVLDFLAEHT